MIRFLADSRSLLALPANHQQIPLLLLLALWSASSPLGAQDAECPLRPITEVGVTATAQTWTRVSESGPICVYTRRTPGSNVRDVMATAAIAADPSRVFEVISDYASYPQFMPYVVASEVLAKKDGIQWVFQQLAFPVVSDRYYTIRLRADTSLSTQNIYRINWTLAQGTEPTRPGLGVPTLVNNGAWDLRPPVAGAGTQVLYFIHTDPGGNLPSFVVNLANNVAVPAVIEAVRARTTLTPSQISTGSDGRR